MGRAPSYVLFLIHKEKRKGESTRIHREVEWTLLTVVFFIFQMAKRKQAQVCYLLEPVQ